MLQITPNLSLDDKDLQFEYIRASGPGGQNVNKVSSAVHLRFDVENTTSLPPEVKERLKKLAGARLTQANTLVIESRRYRTQEQNRLDAEQKLVNLVKKALIRPKKRRPTRRTISSIAQRLETKKRRSALKQTRQDKNSPD
jgi:ribosome-associated protein